MAVIRVVLQTNSDKDVAVLQALSAHMRDQPGCIQAEDHRSIEFNDNLLHLERWTSPAAWDAAWASVQRTDLGPSVSQILEACQAPHHNGLAESPRAYGTSGLEFYRHSRFSAERSFWQAIDEDERPLSVRWPIWSKIRIVIQMTADTEADISPRLQNAARTRAERGCEHFEFFRSLDYPENIALIELWTDAETYDLHWLDRVRQRRGPPPSAAPSPIARRYGDTGFEFYNHTRYQQIAGVFQPEPLGWRGSMLMM
ncbi:putative quinol monooxygenase [Phenylobacterium immobile]|uniref:putative quinol monooxygenase n=1 Tax=Phenylobacterium immobile TaxID=21 RepID=UPI000ABDEC19|nr:antibiotic biosynthesis monooxygenase [Phenylobacterium immobile]